MFKYMNYVRTAPGVTIQVFLEAADHYSANEMFRAMYGRDKLVMTYAARC